jgi:DNA mismatch endonuclease (patch repair protein)
MGKPDFVFASSKLAIFVDGCFWHGCPQHGRSPTSNTEYWQTKLKRNQVRDRLVSRTLRKGGWSVLRVWEHDLRKPGIIVRKILKAIS